MKYFDNGLVAYLEMEDFDEQGNLKLPVNKPVIIMLQATWCGHCTNFKPIYQQFGSKVNNKVFVANIQADGSDSEKKLMEVIKNVVPGFQGFPTVIVFKNGKYQQTYNGPRTEEGLMKLIETL